MKHEQKYSKALHKNVIEYSPAFNDKRGLFNILLNSIVCGAVCIASSFNPWIIAISYIGFDIISVQLNKNIIKSNVKKLKKCDELYKSKIEINHNRYSSYDEFWKYETDLIRKLIEQSKKEHEQYEQKLKILSKKENVQEDIFNDCFNKLLEYNYIHENINQDLYEKLIKKTKKVQKLIGESKECYIYLDTTFQTYVNELILLLDAFKGLGNSIQTEDIDKCENLLNTFITFLDKTINKIVQHNQIIINTSYDVLKKNLEKE